MVDETNSGVTTIVHTVKPSRRRSRLGSVDNAMLPQRLLDAVYRSTQGECPQERVINVLRDTLAQTIVIYQKRDQSGLLRVPTNTDLLQRLPPYSAANLSQWAIDASEAGHAKVHRLRGAYAWTVVTVPVLLHNRHSSVLTAVFKDGSQTIQRVASALQLGAAHLNIQYLVSNPRCEDGGNRFRYARSESLTRVDVSSGLGNACNAFAVDESIRDKDAFRSSKRDCTMIVGSRFALLQRMQRHTPFRPFVGLNRVFRNHRFWTGVLAGALIVAGLMILQA